MADAIGDAIDRVLTGGNHLGTHAALREWPAPNADVWEVLEKMGAGIEFDAWCAWSAIMLSAPALRKLRDG